MNLVSDAHLLSSERFVDKLITQKQIKPVALHNVLKVVWVNFKNVEISHVSINIYLFEFESSQDITVILDHRPWAIQGHCLNIRQWKTNDNVKDVDFNWIQFWIQIHGL